MKQTYDPVSLDAFTRLLARPDPRDLPRRGHVTRCEGDPNRRATRFPEILMGWLQRRYLEIDVEEPLALARPMPKREVRLSNRGLRVLRPTGTDADHPNRFIVHAPVDSRRM
jgi:hypothetical protein